MREAVEQRIERDPNSGCWLWAGSMIHTGYGRIKAAGRAFMAHRLVYELEVGPIPDGLVLDHKCRTPLCVNPGHLRPVTNEVNVTENSLSFVAANKAKTHCAHGHPLSGRNLQIVRRGRARPSRRCRTCEAASQRRRSARPEVKQRHAALERERRARQNGDCQ
jgi:hypothetical protein